MSSDSTPHWFVSGSRGQLGTALLERLAVAGIPASGCDLDELDVAEPAAVAERLASLPRPLVWANAAAFTQVDRCEREPEAAQRGNAEAPAVLARACADAGAKLVHVSTDYVFAGDASAPYTEEDAPAPRSEYGRSKLAGERAVLAASGDFLVLRTSWVFGAGRNFVAAVLDQAELRRSGAESGPLRVVDDQRGRPTYAVDLAQALIEAVRAGAVGLLHFANAGVASWWELARHALDEAGYADVAIDRIKSADLQTGAPRPAWSVLDTARAEGLGIVPRPWREAVGDYLASPDSPVSPIRGKGKGEGDGG